MAYVLLMAIEEFDFLISQLLELRTTLACNKIFFPFTIFQIFESETHVQVYLVFDFGELQKRLIKEFEGVWINTRDFH